MRLRAFACIATLAAALVATPTPKAGEALDLDAFIAERLVVRDSPTIFTLFAFLNAAGYGEENDLAAGMHPVRQQVRAAVDDALPAALRERAAAFYRTHAAQATPWTYAVVAMSTSGPPAFTFGPEWQEISHEGEFAALAELPDLLREFCAAVHVDRIRAGVRDAYGRTAADHLSAVRREVGRAMRYARIASPQELAGSGELKHAVIVPNLLESHERAFSFVLADTFFSVEGPQSKPGYNPHEFIHAITNPPSYDARWAALRARLQPLYDAVRARPEIAANHATLDGWLDECLVQAVELAYLKDGDPQRAARLAAAASADAGRFDWSVRGSAVAGFLRARLCVGAPR